MAYGFHPAGRLLLALLCAGLAFTAGAQSAAEPFDVSAHNLIVVLRESRGANQLEEGLRPMAAFQATLDDGRQVELETSWYQYLGDMHIRLVFDGQRSMQSATPEDLARLRLSPEQALHLAVSNLRRVYGIPAVSPWSTGLMQVQGTAPELTSSYFLDREFWQGLQQRHPEGLVVAVPRRGGLVYASAANEEAVANLRFGAAALYASGDRTRISSALYLFKDDRWSVFQAPQNP